MEHPITAAGKPAAEKSGAAKKKAGSVFALLLAFVMLLGCLQVFLPGVFAASPPGVPRNVRAASASYNSIKISWSPTASASGYVVYYYSHPRKAYARLAVTKAAGFTNAGLSSGLTYSYKVIAYRTVNGKNLYGKPSGAVSAVPVPSAPASLKAARSGSQSIAISWNAVKGASGYVVYRYNSAKKAYERLKVTAALKTRDDGCSQNMTYYYKAAAFRTVNGKNIYGKPSGAAAVSGAVTPVTTTKPAVTTAPTTAVTTTAPATTATPAIDSPMSAVWISYLEYDKGMLRGKTQAQFRANLQTAFANCAAVGINTAFVQVRPFGDAVYASAYFPWSASVTGTFGAAPDFDPLQAIIEEAKKENIKIQAWINPFRLMKEAEILTLDDTSVIKQLYNNRAGNDYIKLISGRWYLNPASAQARKLIVDGIAEIVRNYDVDGIHMDDYFYPTTALDFDSYSYAQSGTSLSLQDWRQSNVSKLVADIYKKINSIDSSVDFGISPQGSVENNYSSQYADVRLWCSSPGYLDYICPQLYYGFENQKKPFEATAAQWNAMVADGGVKLVCGLANYKIGKEDVYAGTGKFEWIEHDDIIPRQILFAKTLSHYSGVAFFSYGNLFNPDGSFAELTQNQTLAIKPALN